MTARRAITMLHRRRWWLLFPAVLVTLCFAAAAYWMPPRYRSTVLLVSGPVVTRDLEETTPLDVQRQLIGISEVLQRRSVLAQVIREFQLYPPASGEVREADFGSMESRIKVRVVGNKTFSLSFEDEDRRRAAAVASRLASMVIEDGAAERFRRAEATTAFVETQVEQLRAKLSEQEREIEQYKQRWLRELPEYRASNLALFDTGQDQLEHVDTLIAEQEARRAAIVRELRELEQQGVRAKPADSRLEELRVLLTQLRKRYTDEHPEVARVRDEIETLESSPAGAVHAPSLGSPLQLRYVQLTAEADSIEARLRSARASRRHVLGQMERARQQSDAAPRHEMTLQVMQREYDGNRAQYDTLVKRLQESSLALRLEKADDGAVLRVVEQARVPLQPYAPQRVRILLVGLAAGLGLGVVAVFLAEQVDTTLQDVDDVQRFTGLPVLTSIPSIVAKHRRKGVGETQDTAVMSTDPYGHVAEQYRILATKLRARTVGRRPVVILVTSPMGGEGKTTTSVNLALALSERTDESVILVDADLRKAGVHRFLGRPHGRGLKELLADPDVDLAGFVCRFDNLRLIQAGGSPSTEVSAAGDLSSHNAQRIFERLRDRFAYVIVDAPPLLAMAESHILQHMADVVLLVIRARFTPKELVLRALESLDEAPNLNLILNDTETATTAYGYVYKYYESHYNPTSTKANDSSMGA
ncbi:MAG TPA: AAA family ATPase [Thermoanaerobaculia bacterium]|nr:AAA family ATPase [Thermoanaerobaculia bacterium]